MLRPDAGKFWTAPGVFCHVDCLQAESDIQHSAKISVAILVLTRLPQTHWEAQKFAVLTWCYLYSLLYSLSKCIVSLR